MMIHPNSRYRNWTVLPAIAAIMVRLLAPPSSTPSGRPLLPNTAGRNPIQVENLQPGTTGWLLTKPALYRKIEGYAAATSAAAGDRISVYVSTTAASFRADVYRMGWYGGKGGRLVASFPAMTGHRQPIPRPDPVTGLIAPRWSRSFTLPIQSTWVSGVYMVKLTASSGFQAYIPLVIRDRRPSDFLFVRAVNTDEAYNDWGGKSLYGDAHNPYGSAKWYAHRALKVSFNRPFARAGAGLFFNYEYDMVRWLERNGYDVSYITDVDEDADPGLLLHHRGVLIVGHNEYWSKRIYDGLESAVAHRVNLGVFGGDTAVWQVRYESLDGAPRRVEVCYRDARLDPLNGRTNSEVTTQWAEPPVNRPQQMLLGMSHSASLLHPAPWVVKDASSWVFAGTGLMSGARLPGLVGYEYDHVAPNLPHPATLDILANSPVHNEYSSKDVAQSTIYTAGSGARVINMGSIQWAWGVDNFAPAFVSLPHNERPHVQNWAAQKIAANILGNFRRPR
jgi:hypothetical protein